MIKNVFYLKFALLLLLTNLEHLKCAGLFKYEGSGLLYINTNSDDVDYSDNHREFIEASKDDETTKPIMITNILTESIITKKTKSTTQYRGNEDTEMESISSGNYEPTTEFMYMEESQSNNKIEYINKTDGSDNINIDYLEFTNTPFPEYTKITNIEIINSTNIETTTKETDNENENGDNTESGSGNYASTNTTTRFFTRTSYTDAYTEITHLFPDDFDPQYEIVNAGSGNFDETN